jgi:very-short-patch-repair endonuclease
MRNDRGTHYVHNIPAARRLRDSQTPSEALLWGLLRDRRLLGLKFRRQHAVGRFVLDFYCHELRLAIEIDGAIHNDAVQAQRDRERQQSLEEQGIHFIRVRASDVEQDPERVIQNLTTGIRAFSPSPATKESGEGAGG